MPTLANRVRDTSTTTGTGNVTVSGTPVATFFALSTIPVGSVVDYVMSGQTGSEVEVGRGKILTSTTFSRDQVLNSSNAGSLVNFSAGTKDVFVTIAAESVLTHGASFAMPYALR